MRDIRLPGLLPVRGGDLTFIEVHDTDGREVFYGPTREDIEDICRKYRLDEDKVMEIIRTRRPDIHAFVFVAPIMRGEQ